MKRWILLLVLVTLVGFLGIQLYRPSISTAGSTSEIHAPEEVKAVLRKDCYSCHSNETRFEWFDQVQPGYSLVRKDVLDARRHLNFSTLGSKPAAAQKAVLYEAVTMMQLGAMPLARFTALHPDARVSRQDLDLIERWLSPWNSPILDAMSDTAPVSSRTDTGQISASPGGLSYDAGWHHWKLLAVTDRGDNRQFRMVLGNDIAVRAAREGNVHPWPDGTRFAKPAWFQAQSLDGTVIPTGFWQVELMVKDHATFKASDGWAWGRWRGVPLKPYGKDASVVKECTGCHLPVKDNDSVYTHPFSAAPAFGQEVLNAASVRWPSPLHFDPLTWTPVTLFVDPKRKEIAVLFAEEESNAMPDADLHGKLALVTWSEREDPHWFGARMADEVLSVETLNVQDGHATSYQFLSASSAFRGPADFVGRSQWIAALRAPVMR